MDLQHRAPKREESDVYLVADTLKQEPLAEEDVEIVGKDDPHYEPHVKLLAIRFVAVVLLSVGALIGFMAIFLSDIPLGHNISDPIGSSSNADKRVEQYQLLNGYISAAAGEILNQLFMIFLVVMMTYLGNLPWHPGQNPRMGRGRGKSIALWWFAPIMLYVLNVGITSMNIKHSIIGVDHAFSADDLASTVSLSSDSDDNTDVRNTILKTAVRSYVTPYSIDSTSSCLLATNTSVDTDSIALSIQEMSTMPTVNSIDSTSVVFGFTTNSWNYDALPTAPSPTHSVEFTGGNYSEEAFTAFQAQTGFDFVTGYEMFLQGKALLERSVSDSNVSTEYPCSWVDGKYDEDTDAQDAFSLFSNDSEYAGMRICNGAVSSLQELANMSDPSTHNLLSFVDTIVAGMNITLSQTSLLDTANIDFLLETYTLSSQLNVTMMTLDIPFDASVQYRNLSEDCTDGNISSDVYDTSTYTADELAWLNEFYCTAEYYVYSSPAATCGSDSCVFIDKSGITPLKKQILLLPYLKNCSVDNMQYNSDYLNFLPTECAPEDNSVFLYGSGAYMSGDGFYESSTLPYIDFPRRHLVFSFAKLDWQMDDVTKFFNAACGVEGGCSGLVHKLENTTNPGSKTVSALVVGNSTTPSERMDATFINPIHLVAFNAQPLDYPGTDERHLWEYLNKDWLGNVTWEDTLGELNCSVLVDSYIQQVEDNHYYLDDPRQAMYTSALYYLFQDAATKTVTVDDAPKGASSLYLGSTRFTGDTERKKITYSIPLSSAIATFIGIAIVIGFSFLMVVSPVDRAEISTETNFAARYVAVLTDEEYPEEVHDCKFRVQELQEAVRMDDYTVEYVTLQAKSDESVKLFL